MPKVAPISERQISLTVRLLNTFRMQLGGVQRLKIVRPWNESFGDSLGNPTRQRGIEEHKRGQFSFNPSLTRRDSMKAVKPDGL